MQNIPLWFGAEVFIEPGQNPGQIDAWFKQLKEAGMLVTRIRLFETYMHKPDGSWDYTLFDLAYQAAEKYGIAVYGNLFPATAFTDLGGLKFPRDEAHLNAIAVYIKNVVTHFKQFKACYGWVPVNEPGAGAFPTEAYAQKKYAEWKLLQPGPEYLSRGYDHLNFDDERFHLYYNTWFLQWLTEEIHQHDPGSVIHVNNHAIFKNVAEYNFPEWRGFLTSFGGSAHASWHFDYFNRSQYAVAIAANSEIIRSGAGGTPWFMTELQGGNNTYSGFLSLCPTAEEIAQWLWITIGTESRGAIFWCLNPRASGIEAGEWAMLNYHHQPTDRMLAAKEVIGVVNRHLHFFNEAAEVTSGISILYTRESLWIEKTLQTGGKSYEGRDVGGVMKSALGYFEALCEAGMQANFKEIGEYDFSAEDYSCKSIVLAHQVSIPSVYWGLLESFVQKGGKLIMDGLTAYYDENAVALTSLGFPLRNLLGADVLEYKAVDHIQQIDLQSGISLPACRWKGYLQATTGMLNDANTAVKNKLGKGIVYWIPSLAGLGSRVNNNYTGLNRFLSAELGHQHSPFVFEEPQPGLLIKTLQAGERLVTIMVNKSGLHKEFKLLVKNSLLVPGVLFANNSGKIINSHVYISAEETLVILWECK